MDFVQNCHTFQLHEEIVIQFFTTCLTGDVQGLERLLMNDVIMWSDGGGKAWAATLPIFGRERAAKFWIGSAKQIPDELSVEVARINGQPGLIARLDGVAMLTLTFDTQNGHIQHLWAMRNPDKLKHL
jgi:RNA polymerase sigma-70 factor, ECF subfamily